MLDEPRLMREDGYWRGRFAAMASDCELLVEVDNHEAAHALLREVADEARRIEAKFSRYRDDNLLFRINSAEGAAVEVDAETADLLDYAALCHRLSDGRFDISSGILRRAWRFDGSDRLPSPELVAEVRRMVGWDKVEWRRPVLRLPAGMEIDFGGLGKEYAVDRAAGIARARGATGFILNFGGDLFVDGPRRDGTLWNVGVEGPRATGPSVLAQLKVRQGGIATSGDARRYLQRDGRRYGHILDPRTGWPVEGAPGAVTVVGPTCMEAGMLATFAILHGPEARVFLEAQGVHFLIAM
ncbi:MAG: FAD:protein FMN transferase [Gammaproteobacteria bacterium]|nr:FAD:protein FMN transferase [Gammaproteobacteria bacterium]